MTSESKIKCPNCDTEIISDYCYECGYTASGYNYLADKIARETIYEEQKNNSIAETIIKNKYKTINIMNGRVYLHVSYIDADRNNINNFFRHINKKYNASYTYTISKGYYSAF